MSEKVESDEVSTSSKDVYAAPIALGYYPENEIPDAVCSASAPVLVMPESETDRLSNFILSSKDVKDPQASRGRCGLYNLGNTCFMNSGLQCLMGTIPLITFFLDHLQSNKSFDQTLLGQFKYLFAKVWCGQFTMVHPKDFKNTLGIYCTQFQDYRQHDCQEFLALLLDSLHEQLNVRHTSSNQNTEAEPSSQKQPITFEHNIIKSASVDSHPRQEFHLSEHSDMAVNSHTTELTFDNINKSPKTAKNCQHVTSSFDGFRDGPVKDKNHSNLLSYTVNHISEDSNHSSGSGHSSESEQCSVIQNLKLRSSPVVSQSSDMLPAKSTGEHNKILSAYEFHRHLEPCCAQSSKCVNSPKGKDQFVSSSVDESRDGVDTEDMREGFKRVHSLQDLKSSLKQQNEEDDFKLSKAFSDNDLVKKAAGDSGKHAEFETVKDIHIHDAKHGLSEAGTNEEIQVDHVEEPMVLNNAIPTSNVPSIEDLYSKETKTLNTNVLSSDFIDNSVTVDSEKFAKHDNTSNRQEVIEEEDLLSNMVEATREKSGNEPKKIKDTNVRANKKSRSPKGACSAECIDSREKEDCFSMNSVKRMKFEGTEKNLQMQELSKIHKKRLMFGDIQANRNEIGVKENTVLINRAVIESDSDSEIGDEQDVDMERNLSDDENQETDCLGLAVCSEGSSYTASEVLAAEQAWQKYLSRNDSVIVDTFQGQFKSTVVCSECDQVSVTFEPFMYLSVPIPHAMERQLCVIFIPLSGAPTQYLLVLHKQDKIQKAKEQLRSLIGQNDCDIIMAEVLHFHISRILEDHTMLRYINDMSRSIYAFEMDTSLRVEELNDELSVTQNLAPISSTTSQDSLAAVQGSDIFSQMGSFGSYNGTQTSSGSQNQDISTSIDADLEDYQSANYKGGSSLDLMGTALWEWNEGGQDNKRRGSLETESGGEWPMADSTTSNILNIEEDVNGTSMATLEPGENSVSSTSAVVTNEWKSCAICLEELTDNELMVHTACGGTFCPNCLEMSVQHYRDSSYCCPVCSTPADIAGDFVPLASAANHKPKTRIVTVPITYRCEADICGRTGPFLYAHPSLINLPSNLMGEYIYGHVERMLNNTCTFRIVLTDGQGLHCSRCLYMEHCTGCEVPRDGEVILRPGDHLTVSVITVTEDQIETGHRVTDHHSMENKRSEEDTSLMDCFTAFTQSEELDEHNPWFCPHCKENRRAKKTMTVWQYPDTLIIHLKRFLFHELSSTKVDNKVVFPTDDLNLNSFISGPKTKNLKYNLYSIVCHFGGANSGHYTSYARHPVDGQWYYYNDETVSLQSLGTEEFSSTYVLFYQRKGTDRALEIPEDLDLGISSLDTASVPNNMLPSVIYQSQEREITLDSPQQQQQQQQVPSTSCHEVAPSSGSVDLVNSAGILTIEQQAIGLEMEDRVDSSNPGAEQAEADSTDATLDFYS